MAPEDRFYQLCDMYGIAAYRVYAPNRSASMVRIRRQIALSMRAAGCSFPEIGRAMRRDHSTIINLVRPRFNKRRIANVAA